MITQEQFNQILEFTLKTRELTTRDLKGFGLSQYDIQKLLLEQKLERMRRGVYQFIDVQELYQYGKVLIKEKRHSDAVTCFHTCYEMNPEDINVCFQMFYRALQEEKYEDAIMYAQKLEGNLEENDELDFRICLHMINELADLPEEIKNQIVNLSCKAVLSTKEKLHNRRLRVHYMGEDDQLRDYIYRQKYDIAYSVIGRMEEKWTTLNPWKNTIKLLLNKVLVFRNKKTLALATEKKYQELLAHLQVLVIRNPKDIEMDSLLKLTQARIELETTGILPTSTFADTQNIFEALEHQSYKQAYSLWRSYQEKGWRVPNRAIFTLLEDMIHTLEERRKEEATIPNILLYLRKEDLNTAFSLLKEYLNEAGKPEYEAVAIELIKLGYQESDIQFRKMVAIISGNEIETSRYALFCYEALATNNYELADTYLVVLQKLQELGHPYPMLEQLIKMKKRLQNQVVVKEETPVKKESEKTNPERKTEPIVKATPERKVEPIVKTDADQAMLALKYEELQNGCKIVLLKSMPWTRRKHIYKLIKESYPNIRGYGIGLEPDFKQLLLKEHRDERIDVRKIKQAGDQAYKDGDFYECIRNYHILLVHLKKPQAYVFGKLGLAYMKRFAYKKAILYLTIANLLYKESGKDRDFTDLIERLKGNQCEEEQKLYVPFEETEFQNDVNQYYGLEKVEEMATFISSGKTIEDVASMFQLNETDILFLKLIFARNCYANKDFKLGDIYLKSAEKTKGKPKEAIRLLEDIRRNKFFYQNRIEEGAKTFILTR